MGKKEKDCSRICNICNSENNCNNLFCINCGLTLENNSTEDTSMLNNCYNCNAMNKSDDRFCTNCGYELDATNKYEDILYSTDGIILALLSKIAKIDGKISSKAASYISNIFNTLIINRDNKEEAKDIYKKIVNLEKNNLNNIYDFCILLINNEIDRESMTYIISILVELAFIDGVYSEEAENIIVKIVHDLDLDFSIYQNIKNKLESNNTNDKRETTNSDFSLEECYSTLGCSESDTMDIIKNNYRKLVKRYHYDFIVSKDLPDDILKFADERIKNINIAYAKIKKIKG